MTAPMLIPGEKQGVLVAALQDAIVHIESGAAAAGCQHCESLHGHRCPGHHASGPAVTEYRKLLRALTAPQDGVPARPALDAGASLSELLPALQRAREVLRAAEARALELEELIAEHQRQSGAEAPTAPTRKG